MTPPSLTTVHLLAIVSFFSGGSALLAGETRTDVPSWAREAIWYQIFPERFRNGDPGNDPLPADLLGSWPHEVPEGWRVSDWTGDWYALQPWERSSAGGFYRVNQHRRYGGDLQGIIDKLGYLKELGVNAIYICPIFESPSLHKYDATLYHHVDNNFGPDPQGDRRIWESEDPANPETWKWTTADRLFLSLLEQAHDAGIKIIIDGVFNHVGITFWAFRDVMLKGDQSLYKDWFIINRWDDPLTENNEFEYAGWNGVKELPEIREDKFGIVNGPRQHVHDVIRRWMDPNGDGNPEDGVDGWRLDVAEKVNIEFWKEFRIWVRELNPEALLVGEVWWEDWDSGKMFNASKWLEGDAFDAVMNYRWAREVGHFFKDREKKTSASEFAARLESLRRDYRSDVNFVLMNLMDSHDTDRLASQIVNVDFDYDKGVSAKDNPDYDVRKPDLEEIRTQKLIIVFQMTCLGAPMIYYGDEAGMWGGDDPDERKPMLWEDLKFETEREHPLGKSRAADPNVFDKDLHSHYGTMARLRSELKALSLGSMETVLTDDAKGVFAYLRSHGEERVLVVLNNGPVGADLTLPLRSLEWKKAFSFYENEGLIPGNVARVMGKSALILKATGD